MTNESITTETDRINHMLDLADITEHIPIRNSYDISQSNLRYSQMSDRFRRTFMLGLVCKDTDYV